MDIINFGSLNIDYVYSVSHIVAPGETISSKTLEVFPGGKGLNQSIALARAGAKVYHAGMIGEDGELLLNILRESGVDTSLIRKSHVRTGNAIIQVAESGQNSIVLYGGANRQLTPAYIDEVLAQFGQDTMVLLQNETNLGNYVIEKAGARGMKIAVNPSPCDNNLQDFNLQKATYIILNEIEGAQITSKQDNNEILRTMAQMHPSSTIILTLGQGGVLLSSKDTQLKHGIYEVPIVDSTAAGDTFTGFFLASALEGKSYDHSLEIASKAAALSISKKGASVSIPTLDAVLQMWHV